MPESEFLKFRTLYDSPMIEVLDYVCRHTGHDHSPEEQSDGNSITLMRHGAFSRHFGKQAVTADVNQATFFSKDSVYRVSHPRCRAPFPRRDRRWHPKRSCSKLGKMSGTWKTNRPNQF